jgi:hypothetical protein
MPRLAQKHYALAGIPIAGGTSAKASQIERCSDPAIEFNPASIKYFCNARWFADPQNIRQTSPDTPDRIMPPRA